MMQSRYRTRCKNCQEYFDPDYRNKERQQYCSNPECRKVSKADSQRRWLEKPENQNYFKGSANVKRVQQWRDEHPGYARNKTPAKKPLQDACNNNFDIKQDITEMGNTALQDVCQSQVAVLIGVISQLTGQVLQDDIATFAQRMQQLGQDILNGSYETKGGKHDFKKSCHTGTGAADSGTVQLGGSPPGP